MNKARITDRQTALRSYRKLINAYWGDLISDGKARTLSRLLDGYLKAEASFKLDEIEGKLSEIEQKISGLTNGGTQ